MLVHVPESMQWALSKNHLYSVQQNKFVNINHPECDMAGAGEN